MSRQIHLYDTTLRDGMQGGGMSLSADEKVRVATRSTRSGSTSSRPASRARTRRRRRSSSCSRAERFEHAADLRLRHDPAPRPRRRRRSGPAPAGRVLRAGLHPGRQDVEAPPREGDQHPPDENLELIADSVAFLAAQGKRVIYDAEHFFDAYRDDPDYALRCLDGGARRRRRERHAVRHQRLQPAHRQVAEATAAWSPEPRRRAGRHPHPQRRRVRRRELACRGRAGRVARAGHDERHRRALRQRRTSCRSSRAPAEAGLRRACPTSSSRR